MKKNILNKNSIPFFVLAMIHLVVVMILFISKPKRKGTWILFLSNMGFAYIFEYVILNIFHGYRYKPSIFKNRFLDEIFGAILSQGLYVPTAATVLTINKKPWHIKILISSLYYFIEKLFINLKVYKVYWWDPFYTFILLNVYFYISDRFYHAITSSKKWAFGVGHYLSIEVIGITLLYVSAVKRKIKFGFGKFHTWKEHFIVAPLYSFLLTLIAVQNASKPGIHNRLMLLFYNIIIDILLSKTGVLKINYKQMLGTIPFHSFMIIISRFLYVKIYQHKEREYD